MSDYGNVYRIARFDRGQVTGWHSYTHNDAHRAGVAFNAFIRDHLDAGRSTVGIYLVRMVALPGWESTPVKIR